MTALDSLGQDLESWHNQMVLPGFAVSVFSADSVLYQKGFGFANKEDSIPYTPQTVQLIASVSKP